MQSIQQERNYPISLKYLKNPNYNSMKDLRNKRKNDKIAETLKCKMYIEQGKHQDTIVRMNERENARIEDLRLQNLDQMKRKGISQTRTKKIIDAERQAQTAMEVSKKNDKPKTGIHYGNLPLFS